MCFRKNDNGRSKGTYNQGLNVINIFHGVNLILYTVTSIYPKTGILIKCYQYFFSENLALFTVTSIQSIQKSTQKETPKQQHER